MKQRSTPTGIGMITDERQRQLTTKGYTRDHDIQYDDGGELVETAVAILERDKCDDCFGVLAKSGGDRIRELVVAGALVAAEIDRLLLGENSG